MKILRLVSSFTLLIFMGTASLGIMSALAEGITQEQGAATLKELQSINKRLEKIEKQGLITANRGRPSRPATAKVSTQGFPILGNANAPITLVEFTDYQCPFCQRFYSNTLPEFKKKYIDTGKVRLVLRDLPLSHHKQARSAARATHCAGVQGMYWQMYDALFENPQKVKQGKFEWMAKKISLDKAEFSRCMKSDRFKERIDRDVADASKAQITVTPTFILGMTTDNMMNGARLVGAQPLAAFEGHLQKLLKNVESKTKTN